MNERILPKIESATDEALKISIVKMLVFQKLKDKVDNESLKNRINSKSNDFYKPNGIDLKDPNSFNSFIEKLSNKF